MRHLYSVCAVIACAFAAVPASADIISDLATATIIEDFQFNDAGGTQYDAAANAANAGNLLSTDTTPADLAGVNTNGAGQLNASLKSNTDFGTTLVDTADKSTGRVFGVMELTWDFQSVLDSTENEEVRVTLISSGTSGVLAEFEIQREDDDTLTILGNSVGGTDIPSVVLNGGSLTQIAKFIAVIEADLDADTFNVHFSSDAGVSFTSLGGGTTDPTRNLDKMRLVFNNDLSSDNVLVDRAYLAMAAVIPEPTTASLAGVALLITAGRRRMFTR